jgi:hypothetical protein
VLAEIADAEHPRLTERHRWVMVDAMVAMNRFDRSLPRPCAARGCVPWTILAGVSVTDEAREA